MPAPFNGPSSSFEINQEAKTIVNDIGALFPGLNYPPKIIDPEVINVPLPALPASLTMNLPLVRISFGGAEVQVPPSSLPITPNSDNYFKIGYFGSGATSDFAQGSLVLSGSGAYVGTYSPTASLVHSISPVSIIDNQKLSMQWTGAVGASGFNWGPGVLDINNNGYALVTRGTTSYLYSVFRGNLNSVLQSINAPNIWNGYHQVVFSITYLGPGVNPRTFSYYIEVYVDSAARPLITYTDTGSFVAPIRISPCYFSSNPAQTFIRNWVWSYPAGVGLVGWIGQSVPVGAAPPIEAGARNIYLVSSGSSPLSIISLADNSSISTRVQKLRNTLVQIKGAYL